MANPKLDAVNRLRIIIESSTPLILMETVEELRALETIRRAATQLQMPVFEWSIADGLVKSGAAASAESDGQAAPVVGQVPVVLGGEQFRMDNSAPQIFNTKEAVAVLAHIETLKVEAVFVLKDLHRHLESPMVIRLVREVAQEFSKDRRTMVLVAPQFTVPAELANIVEHLDLPLPDKVRLKQIISEQCTKLGKKRKLQMKLDAAGVEAVAANLTGLTEDEAERAVAQSLMTRYGLFPESITDVLDAKRDILKRSGTMEFIPTSDKLSDVGGLDNLKSWLRKRRAAFGEGAKEAGLEPPKGVIILGVQGCGKSMCARAIAGEWGLPLVKFDAASIYDKYIGETEKRIQKMFRVAEQLAPCVLWIDELEKVFAGSGPDSASSDAGTSARLLGSFLSWMQDRKAPVFVAATSNNVMVLPPELIRKGRFDELFFVDLPNQREREAVFKVHLARRKADPAKFDLPKLIAATKGFSGAEIEGAIQAAMYSCFADKAAMATESILTEVAATVPLSTTRQEDIAKLREWARQRAVPASIADSEAAGT